MPGLASRWLSWRRRGRWWFYHGSISAVDNRIPVGCRAVAIIRVLFHAINVFHSMPIERHVNGLGQRDRIVHRELNLHLIVVHHANPLDGMQFIAHWDE